jgi:hypothetical protein
MFHPIYSFSREAQAQREAHFAQQLLTVCATFRLAISSRDDFFFSVEKGTATETQAIEGKCIWAWYLVKRLQALLSTAGKGPTPWAAGHR